MDMTDADATDRPAACLEPERRQFDFWVGEWEVHDPSGTLVGRNSISPLFDGCALRETWRGESGHRGTSLNAWSPQRQAWRQTWVDASGLVLELEGGLHDGAMVLEGEAALPGEWDRPLRHRIIWSTIDGDPDRLRQHWEASAAGEAWVTVFDGRYRRVSG
jgi:hypothetical protein